MLTLQWQRGMVQHEKLEVMPEVTVADDDDPRPKTDQHGGYAAHV